MVGHKSLPILAAQSILVKTKASVYAQIPFSSFLQMHVTLLLTSKCYESIICLQGLVSPDEVESRLLAKGDI